MQERLFLILRHSLDKFVVFELNLPTSSVNVILIHTLFNSRSIAVPRSSKYSRTTRLHALLQRFGSLLGRLLLLRSLGLLRGRFAGFALFGLAPLCIDETMMA